MLELVAEAKAQGLPEHRASQVLRISPRSLQRWRQPAQPKAPAAPRPRPTNALTRAEAAAVVSVIRSPAHADQSCRELALSLENKPESPVSVSHVTVWRYQAALDCNGPRGRRVNRRHGPAPDTDWVSGPNQLWDHDGRPFGRLVNVSSGTTHHQGCASSPWRSKGPSTFGSVSFQGTRASRAGKTDSQQANVQERMGRG